MRTLHASPRLNRSKPVSDYRRFAFQQSPAIIERLMSHTAPATPPTEPTNAAPDKRALEAACRAALAEINRIYRVTPTRPGVAGYREQQEACARLDAQRTALLAVVVEGDKARPAEIITAKAAIVEYAPTQCKEAGAMVFDKTDSNGTLVFKAPSRSRPGMWNVTRVSEGGLVTCGCSASKSCWHNPAAKELAALYRQEHEALTQVQNLTGPALDAFEDEEGGAM